ncbi:hypothetical protein [Silvimonas iriomotensis]|uniref:Uncharacterized protein n=1 Tax=Silvimonas iriomotensis TaxID=449662 RepID=A0ABQ2PDX8_9NEIS|nr:hypothetical protein [Silvimonas iriomotensis]GGP23526.1 hypothetical protein GCM10010970_35260 [Silvimonas iriomotensis]
MRMSAWAASLVLAASAVQAGDAAGLQISGQSMQPQTGTLSVPAVNHHGQLQFKLAQAVTVTGWPASLPSRLGKQTVTLQMLANPGGSATVMHFARPGEASPWLSLIQNGQSGSRLANTWTLRIQADRVTLQDQDAALRLVVPGQPLVLRDKTGIRWQFELLGVQPAGTGTDNPPRASWYLRRL